MIDYGRGRYSILLNTGAAASSDGRPDDVCSAGSLTPALVIQEVRIDREAVLRSGT
jgi:hypothetical protein